MKKSDLKKLEKEELIELIIKLTKLNKDNKVFIETTLTNDSNKLLEMSYKKLEKAFCCFENLSLKDARTVLTNFKKLNKNNENLLELYFYYINCANELDKSDWRFQENFYSAIEKVFNLVFDILKTEKKLFEKYENKLKKLINEANDGWGLKDYLEEEFEELNNE